MAETHESVEMETLTGEAVASASVVSSEGIVAAVVPSVSVVEAASAAPPVRRRARKDGTGDEAAGEEGADADDVVAEQVPAAPVAEAAAAATGGQAVAAPSIGGFLTGSGLVLNPVLLAGAVVGTVAVAAVAVAGGGETEPAPPANRAPTATADTATATEDAAVVTGSTATNDSDPDGDTLTFALTSPVPGLSLDQNGAYRFDPSHASYQDLGAGETRVVTANYTVTDASGRSATSTLTITVTGTNDGPTAVADSLAVIEDTAVVPGSVATNDADVDGDTLTYALVAPVDGLTFNPDGTYAFDPSHAAYQGLGEGEVRDIVVRYTVSDGHGGTAEATLTIRVTGVVDLPPNQGPVAVSDAFDTDEDTELSGSVAGNDSDPDGDTLTYALVDRFPGLDFKPDGSFTFYTDRIEYQSLGAGETRELRIPYVVTDSRGGRSTAELVIVVHGVNDAPTTANISIASEEDAGVVRGLLGASDEDDGHQLTYHLPDPAPAGLSFDGQGGYSFNPADPAYQSLKLGEIRTITTTYTVTDEHGALATATLTITVTGTNDAPTATVETRQATEDGDVLNGWVSAKVTDIDGDTLTYALNAPVDGLTFNDDGSYSFDPSHAAYQDLNQGETRDVVATYTVSDGKGGTTTSTLTIVVTGRDERPNTPPVVVDDTLSASEDASVLEGSVAANDSDNEGDALTYTVTTGAPGLSMGTDGKWTFDPSNVAYQGLAKDETREVKVTFLVSDGHGGETESTLTITVTGTNDTPHASADVVTTPVSEDSAAISGSVATNDTDADIKDALIYTLNTPVAGLLLNDDGSYTFDPKDKAYQAMKQGDITTIVAHYTVNDGKGGTSTSTLTITVTGTNDAPVAVAEEREATEDGAKLSGTVASNVTDAEGNALTYELEADVDGLSFNPDGSYIFDPSHAAYQDLNEGDTLEVIVHYTVSDGQGGTTSSTLTIFVAGRNERPNVEPVVVNDTLAAKEGIGVLGGSLATNDSDPDGDALEYRLVLAPGEVVPPGFLLVDKHGNYSFNPAVGAYDDLGEGETREVTATFEVIDGYGGRKTSTLTITVTGTNDGPKAHADALAVAEDGGPVTGSMRLNDTDVDTDLSQLIYSIEDGDVPDGFTFNSDGTYSFDPRHPAYQYLREGRSIEIRVPYTVTDDFGATSTSVLVITVHGSNDSPTASAITLTTTEDLASFGGSLGTVADDVDDGDPLVFTLSAPVAGLTLSPNGTFQFNPGDPAYQSLGLGEVLEITVTYTVTDRAGKSATADFTIKVTGTNDGPKATVDGYNEPVYEDDAGISGSVAVNDFDPDQPRESLNFTMVTPLIDGMEMDPNGDWRFDPSHQSYQSLAEGEPLTITVKYRVTDKHGAWEESTLTFTIVGKNDAPAVLLAETGAATEGGSKVTGSIVDNINDVDNESTRTYSIVGSEPPGMKFDVTNGTYVFDPTDPAYQSLYEGQTKDVVLTYRVTDEHGGSVESTITITVTGTNDGPVAVNDVAAAKEDDAVVRGSVAPDHDPDAQAVLTYTLAPNQILPAGFAFNTDPLVKGSYTFDPAHAAYQSLKQGQELVLTIKYVVTDEHGETSEGTLQITVTGTNDIPTADARSLAVDEDGGDIRGNLADHTDDVDHDAVLTFTADTDPLPAGFSFNASTGAYSFDPSNAAYQGMKKDEIRTVEFKYTVTDEHGASTTSTITITVTGTNDAPVATNDTAPAMAIEDGVEVTGTVATNDTDIDTPHDDLRYALVNPPAGLSMDEFGNYTFNPKDRAYQHLAEGAVDTITATYVVTDGKGGQTTATLTIRITGRNDAPVEPAIQRVAVDEDSGIFNGEAPEVFDADDGHALTYSSRAYPGFAIGVDGKYTFDSTHSAYRHVGAGETEDFYFNYDVVDEHGARTSGTIVITVTGVNDAPVGGSDEYLITDGVLQVSAADGVLANDLDPDKDPITAELVSGPAQGDLIFNPDGSFKYTPPAGYSGTVTFTYIAKDGSTDGSGTSEPITVTLEVVSNAPTEVKFTKATAGYGEVGGEVLVNRTTAGDQSHSSVVALAGGGYVVVWTDTSGAGGDSAGKSVKAQRFDANGKPVGPEILVNTTTAGDQSGGRVVARADGGFTVIWVDDSGNGDIRGQDFNAAGVPVRGEYTVAAGEPGRQEAPDAIYSQRDGRVYVVWTDHGGENGSDVRRVSTDTQSGSRIILPGREAGDQVDIHMATWPHGANHAVVWKDEGTGEIWGQMQHADASGYTVKAIANGAVSSPDVACLGNEYLFVVSWTEQLESGETVVRCQMRRFDEARSPVITLDAGNSGHAGDSSIAALTDEGFVIVWRESDPAKGDDSGSCIKVQRFDKDGNRVGPAEIVNDSTTGDQTLPEVTALPNGGYVVTWTDSNGDGSGSSIKSQVYGPLPPFQATEQEALNLATKISIDDIPGAPAELTVVLSVAHGQIDATAGTTGAEVTGTGTGTVTITGTRAEINALLAGTGGAAVSYLSTSDTPPGRTVLTVTVNDGTTELTKGQQVITIVPQVEPPTLQDETLFTEAGAGAQTGSLAENDQGAGQDLIYTALEPVPPGFYLNADGTYSFDPTDPAYQSVEAGKTIDVMVLYSVSDGQGGMTTATFVIRLTGTEAGLDDSFAASEEASTGPTVDAEAGALRAGTEHDRLLDGDLIPIPLFEHGSVAQLEGADAQYLREALGAEGDTDLDAFLTALDASGQVETAADRFAGEDLVPASDGFVVLDPMDPLLTPIYAVVV